MLTRFPHRPPEVGVPGENPNLAEPGLILTDFVDRVGDPVPMLAPDGSSHRAEIVLADALRALWLVLGGRPAAEPVGVAYPAHWRTAAVEALRGALASVQEFRGPLPALLVSDATAALTALQHDPGVPSRGVIALCDFGATGTSITLADAANGFQAIGPTVRHDDLSGELIDQALLTPVIGNLSAAGSVDVTGTSAIGSLGRLRAQCRGAKERLSTATVTSMPVALPGVGSDVRVTRTELDDAVRGPLDAFVAELQQTLQRSGIRANDLVAVASVGGGARIPIITTTLSENLRVPVISAPAPELAPAIGAGLIAVRGTVEEGATSMAPVPVPPLPLPGADAAAAPMSSTYRALAWSDADDVPDVAPSESYGEDTGYAPAAAAGDVARPSLDFEESDPAEAEPAAAVPWYRRPVAIIAGAVLLVLAIIGAAVTFLLTSEEEGTEPAETSTTSVTTSPSATTSAPAAPSSAPPPDPQTVTEQAPPPTVVETAPPPPPPPSETPPPSTEAPPSETPPPPSTTTPPPPPPSETTTQPPAFAPPYTTVPGLPFVPAPPPIPGIPGVGSP